MPFGKKNPYFAGYVLSIAVALLICFSTTHAFAYTSISPTQVQTMIDNGTAGTVIDVREYDEYCTAYGGHIPGAVNYPWNSGYLQSHLSELDKNEKYIIVCRSGHRSALASEYLNSQGFTNVYNMLGGMGSWQGDALTCDEDFQDCTGAECPVLYFPHVDCSNNWQTEVALINTSDSDPFVGELRAYREDGGLVDTKNIILPVRGRAEYAVKQVFAHPETISYLVLVSDTSDVTGYSKFYMPGIYRVSVPAIHEVGNSRIVIPHIASDNLWWTGLAMVNTTDESRDIQIKFSNGATISRTIAAHAHVSFSIRDLFNGAAQTNITSAVIDNCTGLIGLELFGGVDSGILSGIPFEPLHTGELIFPHVVNDSQWWTGLVAYNSASETNTLTVTAYSAAGQQLAQTTQALSSGQRYFGTPGMLQLPATTSWFRVQSTQPLSGFELFGRVDVDELAGFATNEEISTSGILPKLDPAGWTGVVLVNTTESTQEIALEAVANNGQVVASGTILLKAHEKRVGIAPELFQQDITGANYLRFSATGNVAAFQMNGSSDETMLDAIPAL